MGWFDWLSSKSATDAQPVNSGGVWRTIHEPSTGAWQRNQEIEVSRDSQLLHHAVFACISLINKDVGKLKPLTKRETEGVKQLCSSKVGRILKRPNAIQNSQQFLERWAISKLTHGNTYVLKVRDIFGDIYRLDILDPARIKPLVDPNGNVFYQLKRDRLFDLDKDTVVPASEIIHDRFNCLFHPLVGLSPIAACALSASQGVNIQRDANQFFANASRPSGILVAPGAISETTASELRKRWHENYAGGGSGKTAVLGDGMKYEAMSVNAHDAQLIEQLKMSGEVICSAFNVPPFKVGLGAIPAGQKVGDLNEIYYSDCLQHYIESIENLLTQNLECEDGVEIELNLKALIRMDGSSKMAYLKDGVAGAILSPNEARAELEYLPVDGGGSPMIQQQNYSLAALAKRDAQTDPFNNAPVATSDDKLAAIKDYLNTAYKGVFDAQASYKQGDFVTKAGSLWHCDMNCAGEFNHKHWTLAVKRGAAHELG